MEAIRIIKEMRVATNGKYPRFAIFENVTGAFSSNGGEDFRIVLEEFVKIVEPSATMPAMPGGKWPYADSYVGDGWSIAYRTFDTQYWPRTPQRRKRLYLVADFGSECAYKILFEREGLQGDFAQGESPWEGITAYAGGSIEADDSERICVSFHLTQNPITNQKISHCVSSGNSNNGQATVGVCYPIVPDHRKAVQEALSQSNNLSVDDGRNLNADSRDWTVCMQPNEGTENSTEHAALAQFLFESHAQDARYKGPLDVCPIISAKYGTGGLNQPFIVAPNSILERRTDVEGLDGYNSVLTGDKAATLGVNCGMSTGRNSVLIAAGFKAGQGTKAKGIGWQKEISPTLAGTPSGTNQVPAVCTCFAQNQRNELRDLNGISGALAANHGMKQQTYVVEQIILNDQGGQHLSVQEDGKAPTLRAESHGNLPCVLQASEDIIPLHDKATRYKGGGPSRKNDGSGNGLGVGKPGDPFPTLTAGDRHAVAYANNEDTSSAIPSAPAADHLEKQESVYCVQGNSIDRSDKAGCGGKGWREDVSYTLNTIDRPAVAYLASGKDKVGTLMANAGTKLWLGNQEAFSGDYHVIEEYDNDHICNVSEREDRLNTDLPADTRHVFCQSGFATYSEDGFAPLRASGADCGNGAESLVVSQESITLQQSPNKAADALIVQDAPTKCQEALLAPGLQDDKPVAPAGIRYIVRRLTPTECARLQGFPDHWGHPDVKDTFTDEDYAFWLKVRNEHAAVNGKKTKAYTKSQMLSWYNKLHSDSSEYKMWGNGVALPPTLYCMQGICDAAFNETEPQKE